MTVCSICYNKFALIKLIIRYHIAALRTLHFVKHGNNQSMELTYNKLI